MKKKMGFLIVIICICSLVGCFLLGRYYGTKDLQKQSKASCKQYLSAAIVKLNNGVSFESQKMMIASDLYVAYVNCPDSLIAGRLYDIWNDIITGNNIYSANSEILAEILNSYLESLSLNSN